MKLFIIYKNEKDLLVIEDNVFRDDKILFNRIFIKGERKPHK